MRRAHPVDRDRRAAARRAGRGRRGRRVGVASEDVVLPLRALQPAHKRPVQVFAGASDGGAPPTPQHPWPCAPLCELRELVWVERGFELSHGARRGWRRLGVVQPRLQRLHLTRQLGHKLLMPQARLACRLCLAREPASRRAGTRVSEAAQQVCVALAPRRAGGSALAGGGAQADRELRVGSDPLGTLEERG